MDKAILLAVAASVCTATASLCQRKGAKDNETAGFDARLLVRLARQPAWLLGIAAMIGGFVFQITAPRYGYLALVQPILAAELLFVFGHLAIAGTRRVTGRAVVAPAALRAGLGRLLRRGQRGPGHPPAGGSAGPARPRKLPDMGAAAARPGRGGPRGADRARARPRGGPDRTSQTDPGNKDLEREPAAA